MTTGYLVAAVASALFGTLLALRSRDWSALLWVGVYALLPFVNMLTALVYFCLLMAEVPAVRSRFERFLVVVYRLRGLL